MLPKKVRKELSVNEELHRWFVRERRELYKCTDIRIVVQRRNGMLFRLPVLKLRRDLNGTYIEVGE